MAGPIYFTMFAKRPSYMYTYTDLRWPDPPAPTGFTQARFDFLKERLITAYEHATPLRVYACLSAWTSECVIHSCEIACLLACRISLFFSEGGGRVGTFDLHRYGIGSHSPTRRAGPTYSEQKEAPRAPAKGPRGRRSLPTKRGNRIPTHGQQDGNLGGASSGPRIRFA